MYVAATAKAPQRQATAGTPHRGSSVAPAALASVLRMIPAAPSSRTPSVCAPGKAAASLPNALIAQVCFVPLALSETRDKYHGVLLMLLPACLLVTKLLEAQAFKALAACAGVTGPVWAMLIKADAHARTAHAAALAGRAW